MAQLIIFWPANVLAALETNESPSIGWTTWDIYQALPLPLLNWAPKHCNIVALSIPSVGGVGCLSFTYCCLTALSLRRCWHTGLLTAVHPYLPDVWCIFIDFCPKRLNSDLIWFIAAAWCQPLWPVLCQHRPYQPLSDIIMEGEKRERKTSVLSARPF